MATELEAAPFITGLSPEAPGKKPFPVYINRDYSCIISGIGKANAAMAASYLVYRSGIKTLVNIGAAGATHSACAVGDIFHITQIIEYDRPKLFGRGDRVIIPNILEEFPQATLATQDIPVLEAGHRAGVGRLAGLVDMEGAAFVQACRIFGARAYVFKVVTDIPGHDKDLDIINNIKMTRERLYHYFMEKVISRL